MIRHASIRSFLDQRRKLSRGASQQRPNPSVALVWMRIAAKHPPFDSTSRDGGKGIRSRFGVISTCLTHGIVNAFFHPLFRLDRQCHQFVHAIKSGPLPLERGKLGTAVVTRHSFMQAEYRVAIQSLGILINPIPRLNRCARLQCLAQNKFVR